ncbi:hypothetical protein NSA52_12635 [Clostridium sporogenes]|uniref:hypothetical protein n=1 Tax=Clostridium sporogenes TaxID=1509 RepID=UPI00214A7E57|nr:hypothetical protein [Clostridium sporogenes]MCR1974971.1 hypothetical protein [Clostridium sporogenes]
MLTDISWNELNDKGMIFGTPVTIDGKKYKLRSITGGVKKDPNSPGMLPLDNEWNTIIQNTANISGLPKPTTEDLTNTNTYGQLDGKHNQMWNWWGVRTICQEQFESSTPKQTRGYDSAVAQTGYQPSSIHASMGWRPVLEYIDSDPPEKPTIIKPTGTETEPSVTNTKPVQIETTFNNPGGTFKHMDYEIWDIDLNQRVSNMRFFTTYSAYSPQVPVGHRCKLIVSHTNTADQVSPQATSYFMWGTLNKYKLSEPIMVNQFETIKSYSDGEDLIMKPQTFPETENSVIRLVPKTMNTITGGKVTTTKELEFTASTKTPTIGDRLIKDKEVYTIGRIQEGSKPTNVNKVVDIVAGTANPVFNWKDGSGHKSYVYNGKVYVVYVVDLLNAPKVRIVGMPLGGGTTTDIWSEELSNISSLAMVGKGNMLYTTVALKDVTNIIATNLDTGQSTKGVLSRNGEPRSVSATFDSKSGFLVVVTKEYDVSFKNYSIVAYWYDVANIKAIRRVQVETIATTKGYTEIGNPTIADAGDIHPGNVCVYYTRLIDNKCELIEHRYNSTEYETTKSLWSMANITDAIAVNIMAKNIKDALNKPVLVVSVSYPDTKSDGGEIYTVTKKAGASLQSHTTSTGSRVTTHNITYSQEQGIILIYSMLNGNLYKRSSNDYGQSWGSTEYLGNFTPRPGVQRMFETIDYYPYSYGKYPGLVLLNYENRIDEIKIISDYIMEKPRATAVLLDKPITTSAGEQIKFLDYDLEVKAGESIATVTPTNITDSYYEYEAEFEKKQEERKVTVVGRNSKLTTLYYYNY